MKNISTFNRIFLLVCALLFVTLILAAPHEKESNGKVADEIVNNSE